LRGYRFGPPSEPLSDTRAPVPRNAISIQLIAIMAPPVIAGSGLLNLASLMGGPPPRMEQTWLRVLFPLDFTQIHKTATLVLGFALILTAIHLTGLKRRALYLAICLLLASAILHPTKAWNLSEAVCSLAWGAILMAGRRAFPFGSAEPDLVDSLRRAALAVSIAAAYGVAGFRLLEPGEFGRNFHWWEAASRTLLVMLQPGDTGLSFRTPYATWFLDSLSLLSASAFIYWGVTLFRPVSCRLRRKDSDRELARHVATPHGCSGQDSVQSRPDKSSFLTKHRSSFLAYRVANQFALVPADPVGPEEDIQPTIEKFVDYRYRQGWPVGFLNLIPSYRSGLATVDLMRRRRESVNGAMD
jgi:lysylphosphatidylglycerol synthetase-like protein (DUF2156 family)